MDILNWLYIKSQQLIRTKANDPNTDLIALGANVGFNKRDDQYQTYAMPLKDAVHAGCVANNTLETGVFDIYPYIVTPTLSKTCTRIVDTTPAKLNLQGWKVEGMILLDGSNTYSEYLGTVTIENYNTNLLGLPNLSWKVTGSVETPTILPGVEYFEPLGLFNSVLIGGFGDYAQFGFATFPTVVGDNLELDVVLFVGPAPFTSGSGNLEAIVSFQLETLIDENLNVTFTV
jgi:hypothetical protein